MEIGGKLRKRRDMLGLAVKDIAEKANVTPSLISQIERNIANPSLSTLKKIAAALDLPLSHLFSEEPNISPVIRKQHRRKIFFGSNKNVIQELLSPDSHDNLMQFLYTIYEEGASSEGFVTHNGEECGLVIEGSLELTLGTTSYILEEGDSIYFDSTIPHQFRNRGNGQLKLVWVTSPPSW